VIERHRASRTVRMSTLFLVFFVFGVGYFLLRYPDQHIKQVIRESIAGIETEDMGLTVAYVSERYLDQFGYRKSDLISIARDLFREMDNIAIHISTMEIDRDGDQTEVQITFRTVATYLHQRGYILGDPSQPAVVKLVLTRENEGWRIISMEGLARYRGALTDE
jgi:PAS domain-containing protein